MATEHGIGDPSVGSKQRYARVTRVPVAFLDSLRANLSLPESLTASPSFDASQNIVSDEPGLLDESSTLKLSGEEDTAHDTDSLAGHGEERGPYIYAVSDDYDRKEVICLLSGSVCALGWAVCFKTVTNRMSRLLLCFASIIGFLGFYRSGTNPYRFSITAALSLASLFAIIAWIFLHFWLMARRINSTWLGADDILVIRSLQSGIIGALVIRWQITCGFTSKGKRKRRICAMIRAWAVARSEQGKGYGTLLLETAARSAFSSQRSAESLEFAKDHAHADSMFSLPLLERKDRAAREKLTSISKQREEEFRHA